MNYQDANLSRADLVAMFNTLAVKVANNAVKTVKDFKSKDLARERIAKLLADHPELNAATQTEATQVHPEGVAKGVAAVAVVSDAATQLPVADNYKVLLHNNPNTRAEHVSDILETFLKSLGNDKDVSQDKARELMLEAHSKNTAVVFAGTKLECESTLTFLNNEIAKYETSRDYRAQHVKELKFTIGE